MLIPLPDLPVLFQKVLWTPVIPQQKNRSEFTNRSQTIGLPGAEAWHATAVALPPADIEEMWAWDAFLAACRGSENSFDLPALPLPQTTAANPVVTAAVAGNRAVTVNSIANVRLGMYATVQQADGHPRLVKVTGIAGLNVQFSIDLTANPTIGAELEIGEPYARMQLPQGNQPLTVIGESFQFEAEEAL